MTIKVFDFFAGCGGTSAGLRDAGMEIVFGLDFDEDAGQTFRANFPDATFVLSDIREFRPAELAEMVEYHRRDGSLILFSGCAPCQPFSKQNGRRSTQDQRHDLLDEFSKFVGSLRPDFVFCENVPGMQLFSTAEGPFYRFTKALQRWKYLLLTPPQKPPITAAVAHRAALTPLHGLLIPQAAKICSKSTHRSRSLGR